MARRLVLVGTVGVALAASGGAVAGDAIDLTETYEGTYVCEGTADGFPFTESLDFVGRYVRLHYLDDGAVSSVYEGVIDVLQPGPDFVGGVLQACGDDYAFEELIRIENGYDFEEEDGFTASFDGRSIYVTDDYPSFEGDLNIETCS